MNFITRRNRSDLAVFKNTILVELFVWKRELDAWVRKALVFSQSCFFTRKMSSEGQIPTLPRYDVQKAYPVPFRAATWTDIVRRCQWKLRNCSKRTFDTKTWPTAPGSARDKFCPDSPRPSSHVKRPRKIQLCTHRITKYLGFYINVKNIFKG